MRDTVVALLIFGTLTPYAAHGADPATAPFAQSGCPSQTYQLNGTNGWNYGGTNDLYDGNGQFVSYQPSYATPAVKPNGLGMSVGAVRSGNSLLGTMINTHGRFAQQYGYFEMTAELTEGALQPGMTTAFWLMSEKGGWPPEFDIEESFANVGDTAVHITRDDSAAVSYQDNMKPDTHVWAMDWNPDTTTFYIDGKIPRNRNGALAQTRTPANFHVPMFMIVDVFSNGGEGAMHVKNIRVFRDMPSALACVPSAKTPVFPVTNPVWQMPITTGPAFDPGSLSVRTPPLPTQPTIPDLRTQAQSAGVLSGLSQQEMDLLHQYEALDQQAKAALSAVMEQIGGK